MIIAPATTLGPSDSPVHRLDARAKLLALFTVLVAAVTTPPHAVLAFAGYAMLLLALALLARIPLRRLAKRYLALAVFVLVLTLLIPFLHRPHSTEDVAWKLGFVHVSWSGLTIFWNTFIKSSLGILCAVVLGATTPFPELLEALGRLRVPRVAVLLVGFTYRYLFVLADEATRLLRARDSRCYGGRWLWHAKVIGQMIGTLFLRAHERAERVYAGMVSRGFTGELPRTRHKPLGRAEYALLGVALTACVILRVTMP